MENIILVAQKGIIVKNGKILIVRRAINDFITENMWEFPGGKLEFGEDLEEGLKREVKEETNLDVNIGKLLYSYTFKTHPHRQLVVLSYLCSVDSDVVTLSSEHDEYAWVSKEQLRHSLSSYIVESLDQHSVWELI